MNDVMSSIGNAALILSCFFSNIIIKTLFYFVITGIADTFMSMEIPFELQIWVFWN